MIRAPITPTAAQSLVDALLKVQAAVNDCADADAGVRTLTDSEFRAAFNGRNYEDVYHDFTTAKIAVEAITGQFGIDARIVGSAIS